ncbi:hypothetical protein A3J19_03285 [Candidatus Daviesbacteria bacterium RIFCSPLOWO2_02_FULL_41_8]|uniref:Uncharacterized protein n=2 Tax=Candidatus Daviesiibacteriota TaxID=1752718 RepID=A0A1F5NLC0_9BACT|nr:MAG: hypothetical protein A2871_02015 [Candidatus Daviesbacteria bacterium RIFCSPHIGHO2_01_FULL_41_23]OGE78428.1 MAG: hypothetical protein A3J19_03285 [Candidatus Daviesbacteria bacterium RIFCSPLOWO2_02_FULL_41_8]
MIDEKFVFVSVALILFGNLSYLIYTIKGKVKPNKVTWFLWGLAPLIAFAAEAKQGVGLSSLMTLAIGVGPLFTFIASFLNKKAYWKITKFDFICGVLAVLGLIMWQVTGVGNWAIFFAIAADGLAAVPTFVKAFKAPETEDYKVYLFTGLGAGVTLLATRQWGFAYSAFPVYILLLNIVFAPLIKFKLGKKIHPG